MSERSERPEGDSGDVPRDEGAERLMSERRRRAARGDRSDRGTIAIELIAAVPLLVVVTILLIEGLLAVSAVNIATKAARDGARVYALGGDGDQAARDQVPGWLQVQAVTGDAPGGCAGACATVRLGVPLGFPGFVTITHLPISRSADFPV